MKINIVLGQQLVFPPIRGGGVENLNWLLACEFASLGHEVVVYSRIVPGLAAWEVDSYGIRHVRLKGYNLHPNIWVDHANALKWAVRMWSALEFADVTSFHTAFSFLLRYKAGIGVTAHTIHRTPKGSVSFYRAHDRVYCGGDAVVQQALRIDPRMQNLKRIYNCVSIPSKSLPSDHFRRESEGINFLYLGRFVRDKGLESLIKGFEISISEFPLNKLITIGPQTDSMGADSLFFSDMSRYVQKRGLTAFIEFLPPTFEKDTLATHIMAADVICVPSLAGETFSMAVLEGMSMGKPILVSDFAPMLETIDHKMSGYIARAGDPESICDAVKFFSLKPEELPKLGRAAFNKAREKFAAPVIAREYLQDFKALITARANKESILSNV